MPTSTALYILVMGHVLATEVLTTLASHTAVYSMCKQLGIPLSNWSLVRVTGCHPCFLKVISQQTDEEW